MFVLFNPAFFGSGFDSKMLVDCFASESWAPSEIAVLLCYKHPVLVWGEESGMIVPDEFRGVVAFVDGNDE